MGDEAVPESIETIYTRDSRKVYTTLTRMLGDFDLAEDAVQDAFRAAIKTWLEDGVPRNPISWLISTGRFKAIDALRRRKRFEPLDTFADNLLSSSSDPLSNIYFDNLQDEQLRLIFTFCHPSISSDAQVALTLREVCRLTTEEIARAFLTPATTLAQWIARAKAKIRNANIPFTIPEASDLPGSQVNNPQVDCIILSLLNLVPPRYPFFTIVTGEQLDEWPRRACLDEVVHFVRLA